MPGRAILQAVLLGLAMAQGPGFQEFEVPTNMGFHDPLKGMGKGNKAVTCGAPGVPVFGKVEGTTTGAKPGDMVTYSCTPGHKLVGPKTKKCSKQGYWVPGTMPKCKVMIKRANDGTYGNNNEGWVIGQSNV